MSDSASTGKPTADRIRSGETTLVVDIDVVGRPDGIFVAFQSASSAWSVFRFDATLARHLRSGLDAMLAHDEAGWRSVDDDADDGADEDGVEHDTMS
jgi:hypothetical protein